MQTVVKLELLLLVHTYLRTTLNFYTRDAVVCKICHWTTSFFGKSLYRSTNFIYA